MTPGRRIVRRASGGLVALACGVALAGCGAQSGARTNLESFLRSDAAVADASVDTPGRMFATKTVGHVALKPDADLDAFAQRVAAKLKQVSALSGVQVDAAKGQSGYSIVADDARTEASKKLGTDLRQRFAATDVKGFLGDVQVTVPSGEKVTDAYAKLAADAAVADVAGKDGSVRVGNGTDSLGKRGAQSMDRSFLPAIQAAQHDGTTAYTAYMDRYKGPSFAVTVDSPDHLSGIFDSVRSAGYTGELVATSGTVSLNDDTLVPNLPAAVAISKLPGVAKVELAQVRTKSSPDTMDLHSVFNVDADASTPLSQVSQIIEKQGQDNAGELGITFHVGQGQNVAEGPRSSMPYKLSVLQALEHQQGVQRVSALQNQLVVVLDADHPELWGPACSTLRAHRWMGQQVIHLITQRDGKDVAQAKFESTSTGVSSVVNTGPGSDQGLLDLWNKGASK